MLTDNLPASEQELMEEVKGLSETQIESLRRRAENSLRFFSFAIVGHKDVNRKTHGAFCKFIQSEPRQRRLALMPRLHLKTTIATEDDSLRLGLSNPENERILIVNEVDKNARAMLSAIMGQVEKNDLLRFLWRDVVPERFTGPGVKWSTDGACLVRKTSFKELTWTAMGVGSGAGGVSMHYTRIKCDDLIGLEAYRKQDTEAKLRQAITFVDSIESLIVGANDTIIDWIGTRWFKNDIYGYIMKLYGSRLAVFRRQIVENDEIIFPQKVTWEQIEQLQKKPDLYAANYLNDPISALLRDFDADNIMTFRFNNTRDVCFSNKKWELETLDRVLTVDPNSGSATAPDEAAISALGMAPDENIFLLESYHGRPNPEQFVNIIFELAKKWRPRVIGIEQAGQQNTLFYFKRKCQKEGLYFNVVELKHRNIDKEQRIRTALQPIIASRRLWLLAGQQAARSQLTWFPDIDNDDIADTLAYSIELLKRPEAREEIEKSQRLAELVLLTRSKITGY